MTGVDRERIEAATRELLAAIGERVDRAGLESTPQRVAESYAEFFHGVGEDPLDVLGEGMPLESGDSGEIVIVRDIAFRSMCEHHLLPFIGTAHVAYAPRERVVGLGRIPRVVEVLAARPQVQERLGEQIVEAISTGLQAAGVLVIMDAAHTCVSARGTQQARSTTVTLASRGTLADPVERAEVVALIARGGDE
ncbi:GTP cyclohydrolase I FolE [Paramicrobacterium chengjingii]|uniref:GTP cyclohydrolase 1 n=1 Tax=Paramicrobacterium chengjingii TaxID=2769067 RepID=A0ABX6YG19_9MICO|nr:GTP cyclohydrolase I FolE [Microbacterium chengjingii]QPZ37625.1 GTP cyclohydrolase I FolE [Microbacterium chengjingii]